MLWRVPGNGPGWTCALNQFYSWLICSGEIVRRSSGKWSCMWTFFKLWRIQNTECKKNMEHRKHGHLKTQTKETYGSEKSLHVWSQRRWYIQSWATFKGAGRVWTATVSSYILSPVLSCSICILIGPDSHIVYCLAEDVMSPWVHEPSLVSLCRDHRDQFLFFRLSRGTFGGGSSGTGTSWAWSWGDVSYSMKSYECAD